MSNNLSRYHHDCRGENLPEETVMDVVQQAIAAAWRRDDGDRDQDVRAELNTVKGTATVYVMYQVVEEVENPATELTEADAQKLKKGAKVGDVVEGEARSDWFWPRRCPDRQSKWCCKTPRSRA